MSRKIKWIFFDAGYTLVNEDEAQLRRVRSVIAAEAKWGRVWTEEQIFSEMRRAAQRYDTQFYGALNALGIYGEYPFPRQYEKLYPWVKPLLTDLKDKVNLGLIANQRMGYEKRIKEGFGLGGIFQVTAVSGDLGVSKPSPVIFRYALEKANANPEECVMVGDRIDNDILPAKKLGMVTVWIKQGLGGFQKPTKEEMPDFIAFDGKELSGILNALLTQ